MDYIYVVVLLCSLLSLASGGLSSCLVSLQQVGLLEALLLLLSEIRFKIERILCKGDLAIL